MSELISVIIPTYNRGNVIADAINTVLGQTYQNFEIIIVDDGSTDNTSEVVQSFGDFRIKYIYRENSGRPSIARNIGIKNATGEYIAFLDSDDLWHPEKLEKQASVLENNKDVGLVTNRSLYKLFDGQEIKIKRNLAKNQKENIIYILSSPDKVFTGTPTLLIRKVCFERVGLFDETMKFCEDWDLFFRISLVYGIYNVDEVLTYVRIHSEGMSKNSDMSEFYQGYLKFLQKAFENEKLPLEYVKIKNEAYSNAFYSIGGLEMSRSGDYLSAGKHLLESVKYSCKKLFNLKFLTKLIVCCVPLGQRVYEQTKKRVGNC